MTAGWMSKYYGELVDPKHADVLEVLDAAGPRYIVDLKQGGVVMLTPTGASRFRRFMWYVSFNPPNLYFPHWWFHEASSENGLIFNRQMHGPQAVSLLAEELRKVDAASVVFPKDS